MKSLIIPFNSHTFSFTFRASTNKKSLSKRRDFLQYKKTIKYYNSNAFLGSLFNNNSIGFSKASLTATKKPTDSRPSMIL